MLNQVLLRLFRDDVVTQLDALVTNMNGGTGNELLYLSLAFSAEAANQISKTIAVTPAHNIKPPRVAKKLLLIFGLPFLGLECFASLVNHSIH